MAGPIEVTIAYFYDRDPLDVDNMVKPILDALSGAVYGDDRQVTDISAKRRSLYSFRGEITSGVLAEAFDGGHEFLHIEITAMPKPEGS